MSNEEQILIKALLMVVDQNKRAFILQTFIQQYGPVSDEAGEQIKRILAS